MSEPRRHHLVPQFYLRRFSCKNKLRMANRASGTKVVTSVSNAAVQNDFYTLRRDDGGDSYAVERRLSQIEGHTAIALQHFAGGTFPPSEEDRLQLSVFIALQALRGTDFREDHRTMGRKLVDHIIATTGPEQVRRGIRDAGHEPTDEEVQASFEHMEESLAHYAVEPPPEESIAMMLEMAAKVAPTFYERTWLLLRAPDVSFVTSDAPVVRWMNPEFGENPYGPYGVGLLTANEIRFPVDSRHVLCLWPAGVASEQVIDLDAEDIPEMNYSIAVSAHKWVFHDPDHDLLAGIDLPPPGPRGRFL